MKDYQLQGLSFLAYMAENGMSAVLADECVSLPFLYLSLAEQGSDTEWS
jgi:hypothetical protein